MKNNHNPAFCLTHRNHIISTQQSLSFISTHYCPVKVDSSLFELIEKFSLTIVCNFSL